MLDIRQIDCFLAIVEHGSFTRAAETLGVAQSAVSQKLLRLEDQLGIRLLQRTSRSLALTREGHDFVPFARNIVEAEARARHAAQRMLQRSRHTVKIGTLHSLIEMRGEVIERYLSRAPETQIEVEFGSRLQLLDMLRDNVIDCCLCIAGPEGPVPDVDPFHFRSLVGHLAVPLGHLLAGREILEVEDFRDLEMVISPGKEDSPILEAFAQSLSALGAFLNRAPEAERRLIEIFARGRGLPSMRWVPQGTPVHLQDGQKVIPIRGDPFAMDYLIYFRKERQNAAAERFRAFVREITAEQGSSS